ncbi:C40 family peptidase [Streptomyces reniochalinae]|uniref:NlpC/P60 family protein n=1 Tax=Streptomyces reniochalinae TaxID=2250578 RepID=A0A367ENI5_9ACTN|nr:NlpC/P60 family protein [Streptomyces reniochalinae]RCG19262.1 NlpC/P60 family protein [Streptomyces reniochalinae]
MASHRKPPPRPRPLTAARAALTLTLAGIAGATSLGGTAHADKAPAGQAPADRESADRAPAGKAPSDESPADKADVKAKVDRLHREAESATEAYNGAHGKAEAAREELESLRDEAARTQAGLNTARAALGGYAAQQYREGSGVSPTLRLALSATPSAYLEHAALAERVADRRATTLRRTAARTRHLAQLRKEAAGASDELDRSAEAARGHKSAVQRKLRAAQRLLDTLTAQQRADVLGEPADPSPTDGGRKASPSATESGRGGRAGGTGNGAGVTKKSDASPARHPAGAATAGRSARAVAFAHRALGKPYVWGGTGPSGYDCSGLTQAAWKAAGVSLPRTTYSQIHAGTRVTRSRLAPGDLVFFYDNVSHVGLYIGGGRMIHAPRPGTSVRVAPIDQMPFAGAVRPSGATSTGG